MLFLLEDAYVIFMEGVCGIRAFCQLDFHQGNVFPTLEFTLVVVSL